MGGASKKSARDRKLDRTRVLIVDDHPGVRASIEAIVQRSHDLAVAGSAADGRAAVEMAVELLPDVILMDLSLPVLDGVEATRRLASRFSRPAVVAFTGWPSLAREALDAGAVACLFKDATPSELLAALRSAGP